MKKISIVTPCYNEEGNIYNMYMAIKKVMKPYEMKYEYEHLFIDNNSKDRSQEILKNISEEDSRVKIILNQRNFGPNPSGAYAMYQTTGDAVICLPCDFQDPPEYIRLFIDKWEEGYKVVWGKKTASKESKIMYKIRSLYYWIIQKFSEIPQYSHATGFGLYDKEVIDLLKSFDDPMPIFRNIIAELGYDIYFLEYEQNKREHGKSSYSLRSYFDAAMDSLLASSYVPLRFITYMGLLMGVLSVVLGSAYLVYRLICHNFDNIGVALIVICITIYISLQTFFLGIIGEYVGSMHKRLKGRPLVIEKERINFEE